MAYFLGYTLNILDSDSEPVFIGSELNSEPQFISLLEVVSNNTELVVFNAIPLVDYLRRSRINLPKNIVDIFQIFKLIVGKPSKYHFYSEQQIIYSVLTRYIDNKEQLKAVVESLNTPSGQIIESSYKENLFKYVQFLKATYQSLHKDLVCRNEYFRYETVEKPFNQLLLRRQYEGILVCAETLHKKIESSTRELNGLIKLLRYDHDIINFKDVAELKLALQRKGYDYLAKVATHTQRKQSFWSFVKAGAESDNFLKLLYTSYKLSFERANLLKIVLERDGMVYPVFDCCGSVTARVQVRYPLVQQLKKSSRNIFLPSKGYTLLYVDYSQFEPGILASLAEDQGLMELYNQVDLYEALSHELFGTASMRSLCKTIFLCFIYGMSDAGLKYLVKDCYNGTDNFKNEELERFFGKFSRLVPYKKRVLDAALRERKVGSALGNHRYINSKSGTSLPNKVKRWVLSQKVQGTASLIFKTAILNCCADSQIEFLIPMHDAALFQVPNELCNNKKAFIALEFKSAMLKYCPQLKPKIVFKEFTE